MPSSWLPQHGTEKVEPPTRPPAPSNEHEGRNVASAFPCASIELPSARRRPDGERKALRSTCPCASSVLGRGALGWNHGNHRPHVLALWLRDPSFEKKILRFRSEIPFLRVEGTDERPRSFRSTNGPREDRTGENVWMGIDSSESIGNPIRYRNGTCSSMKKGTCKTIGDPSTRRWTVSEAMGWFGCLLPKRSNRIRASKEDASEEEEAIQDGFGTETIEEEEGTRVHRVMERNRERFGRFASRPDKHRVQILWTEIDEWQVRGARLSTSRFRVGQEYIYPASTVKLCAAVAALSQLRRLRRKTQVRVTPWTPIKIHPSPSTGHEFLCIDESNVSDGKLTVAHLIRKVFLASDNPAHNALCAVAGYRYLHEIMWNHGLKSLMLYHPISADWGDQGEYFVPAIEFWPEDGPPFSIPCRRWSPPPQDHSSDIPIGSAHIDNNGKYIEKPISFARKNRFSLDNLHRLVLMISRPHWFGGTPFGLGHEDLRFLQHVMQLHTTESVNPCYKLQRDWNKLFAGGAEKALGSNGLIIQNKLGQAYGFTLDSALIEDTKTGRSFNLTVAVYTNENGVLNDDVYEYSDAEKFLADITEALIVECCTEGSEMRMHREKE